MSSSQSREERLLAAMLYVSGFFGFILVFPIAAFFICRSNDYIRRHARRAMAVQAALLIGPAAGYAISLAGLATVGLLVAFAAYLVALVFMIGGAVNAWAAKPTAAREP